MKTKVEMPKSILNDKDNWRFVGTSYYMSGHMYRGTSMEAFETMTHVETAMAQDATTARKERFLRIGH